MSFVRVALSGLVLVTLTAFAGCGEGGGGTAPKVDEARPDAGLEASKKLQPPPPPGGKKAHKN